MLRLPPQEVLASRLKGASVNPHATVTAARAGTEQEGKTGATLPTAMVARLTTAAETAMRADASREIMGDLDGARVTEAIARLPLTRGCDQTTRGTHVRGDTLKCTCPGAMQLTATGERTHSTPLYELNYGSEQHRSATL